MPTAAAHAFSPALLLHRAPYASKKPERADFPALERNRWMAVVTNFTPRVGLALWIATLLASTLLLSIPAHAADIFTVNSTADEIDANVSDGICRTASGKCTLRAAVMQASRSTAGATINVPAGIYQLSLPPSSGELGGDLNLLSPATGNPEIRIIGAGRTATEIYSPNDRAFTVHSGRKAYIGDLGIFESGDSTEFCNGGGAICNLGTLGLKRVLLKYNTAYFFTHGGAIYNDGVLFLVEAALVDNSSWSGLGGAVYNTGFLAIQDSTITGNSAYASGGAIHTDSTLEVVRTTIAYNYLISVEPQPAVAGSETT